MIEAKRTTESNSRIPGITYMYTPRHRSSMIRGLYHYQDLFRLLYGRNPYRIPTSLREYREEKKLEQESLVHQQTHRQEQEEDRYIIYT